MNILVWWSLQDWDFPHFVNNFDIKLPGLNIAHFKFHIPNCAKRYSEDWYVHVSGKQLLHLYLSVKLYLFIICTSSVPVAMPWVQSKPLWEPHFTCI